MTKLAIFHPTDLAATELREALDDRTDLWHELVLLAGDEKEVGTLTEARGTAAMVTEVDATSFDGVDVAFFFGPAEHYRPHLDALAPGTTAVLFSSDPSAAEGHPLVAGINLDTLRRGDRVASPHPGAVALSHLLHPLLPLGLERAVATVLQPVSIFGKAGLDELFEQTRAVLNFQPVEKREHLPTQLAFNLLRPEGSSDALAAQTRQVLGVDGSGGDDSGGNDSAARKLAISAQVLQAGIFHGFGISLHLVFGEDPGHGAITERLEESPALDFAVDAELMGPIDAAARQEILIGEVQREAGDEGVYSLWAVMDNLTVGGATNALAILEALSDPVGH